MKETNVEKFYSVFNDMEALRESLRAEIGEKMAAKGVDWLYIDIQAPAPKIFSLVNSVLDGNVAVAVTDVYCQNGKVYLIGKSDNGKAYGDFERLLDVHGWFVLAQIVNCKLGWED